MSNIDVGHIIRVNINGGLASAKVRRIGPRGGGGWHMATLDVGGDVAYCVLHERELVQDAQVARQ